MAIRMRLNLNEHISMRESFSNTTFVNRWKGEEWLLLHFSDRHPLLVVEYMNSFILYRESTC